MAFYTVHNYFKSIIENIVCFVKCTNFNFKVVHVGNMWSSCVQFWVLFLNINNSMIKNYFSVYILASILFFTPVTSLFAQTDAEAGSTVEQVVQQKSEIQPDTLYFFHSVTCPHCREEQKFLDTIQKTYPELQIKRYEASDSEHVALMRDLATAHGVEYALGSVPLTFIGDYSIIGYEKESSTGKDIENAIIATLENNDSFVIREHFDVPLLGRVYVDDFSLPVLAVLLGFLDGFNVCSLGALVLIIGLTLKLQRRKSIILLGGTFILTTAVVYGGLIVLWARMFDLFGSRVDNVKIFVALLALGGGLYFLKEFVKMNKQGAQCELQESTLVNALMKKTGKAFEDNTKLLGLIGTVLVFSAVLAIVEFPCSAATPLVFAGVLSSSGVSAFGQLGYIMLFILFYMLDEIIIFGIAAYRLKLWMTSGVFTKYAVLAEALILIIIGLFFLQPVIEKILGS